MSRLSIDVDRSSPDAAIVYCRGELVAGLTDLLYSEVRQLIPHHKRIVLDMKELTYADSSGIGVMVRVYVSARAAKCEVELANINGRIRQILGISDLLSVFRVIGENNIRL